MLKYSTASTAASFEATRHGTTLEAPEINPECQQVLHHVWSSIFHEILQLIAWSPSETLLRAD